MDAQSSDDIRRDIDRLWARLGPGADLTVPFTPPMTPVAGAEVAWETVSLLKRQQREREAAWGQAFEAKEQSQRLLRERLASLESDNADLRARLANSDGAILAELMDARSRLEGAAKALDLQSRNHDEEREALSQALAEARARFEQEAARVRESERKREAREAQHLLDLQEFQALADRRAEDLSKAESSASALKSSLAEAKNALEKTLAELLLERRSREETEEERARVHKRLEDMQSRFAELEKVWEEERGQWRELWDRERSSWETQRQELAQWEERLRRERESWHAELRAREASHLVFTDDLSARLRDTTRAAERMDEALLGLGARAESKGRGAEASERRRALRAWAVRAGLALAAAGVLAAGARWSRSWRWASESAAPVAARNPTALAYDGNLLWIADWSGGVGAVDPADPRRAAASFLPPAGGPYRPTAIAFGAGLMWTLDAAQARVLRHPAGRPDKVLASRPSPGPAPTALAFDGSSLWSYDAANRSFYQHGADEAMTKSFTLEGDAVPNAMAWRSGRLWVHDSKSGRLLVLEPRDGRLFPVEAGPAPARGLLGLAFGTPQGRELVLFALSGPSAENAAPSLLKLRLGRRMPVAGF